MAILLGSAIYILCVLFITQGNARKPKVTSPKIVMDRIFENYMKQEPPVKESHHPTGVSLGIYINSFHSINEQTMDYQVNMYMRQSWRDPRLVFDAIDGKITRIRLDIGDTKKLWLPDTFFRNEKRADYHQVTVPNVLMTLNATGHVWYVTKISATLSCPMKLQKYPLDTQSCPIMFESFGYTMDTMYFTWLPSPVDIDPNVQLPTFTLVDKILYDCSQNYTAGAFPCLEIRFILRRNIGHFILQVYLPSILIVIFSWVAFWINVDAIPARVSLGLLSVLTMSSGARSTLPHVSYLKAIDVWMFMCLFFVFASLLEFAAVTSRREGRKDEDPEMQRDQIDIVDNGGNGRKAPRVVNQEGKASKIDKVSRVLFPVAFLVFNIVYWIIYTMP